VKRLDKGVPHDLTAIKKKIIVLKCYSTQQQWTVSQSDCVIRRKVDFIWQSVTTSSVAEPRRSFKTLPKAKFAPKKGYDHCLAVCCLPDPLQLSESQQNYCIWEVSSANWWYVLKTTVTTAGIGQQKGPNSSPQQHPTACHTINTFLPMRNKFVSSRSIKIRASGFDRLLESIFCFLLIVEAFCLQEVVLLEEVVGGWQEVRWIWQMRHNLVAQFIQLLKCWLCGFYFD